MSRILKPTMRANNRLYLPKGYALIQRKGNFWHHSYDGRIPIGQPWHFSKKEAYLFIWKCATNPWNTEKA